MYKYFHIFVLLLLPSLTGAEWVLQQSDDGHWITGRNKQQHQLIISQDGRQKQVLLVLSLRHKNFVTPETVNLSIDNNQANEYQLRLLKKRPDGLALQLVLNETEQDQLIGQLVAGLNLQVQFDRQVTTDFALTGFTSTFSDFLIANEIGRLDPLWLQLQNRKKEMVCYEISLAMVRSMEARFEGQSRDAVFAHLSGQMSEEAEAALPDVIVQAFSVPIAELPRIPSTRKYAFFKRCMRRMK